ncbi:cytochrome P450 [Paraphysoderma sedebokerense]|nr:cytochrome P450 [Paraphysoderma sedebokerense]
MQQSAGYAKFILSIYILSSAFHRILIVRKVGRKSFSIPLIKPITPLIGPKNNVFRQLIKYAKQGKVHLFAEELFQVYGSFVSTHVFNKWFYFTCDGDIARTVFRDSENFRRPGTHSKEFGKMLFFLEGPEWKFHRKLLQPAFSPIQVRNSLPVIVEKVNKLFSAWKGKDVAVPNLCRASSTLALDILGSAMFSYDFKNLDDIINDPDADQQTLLEVHMENFVIGLQSRFGLPPWLPNFIRNRIIGNQEKFEAGMRYVSESSMKAIEEKIRNGIEQKDKKDMDIIDLLLSSLEKDSNKLTPEEIADEVFGFFFAGHETTANTITFTIKALCDNPHVLQALQEQIDEFLPSDNPSPTEIQDVLPNLRLLNAFLYETQRYYPVVPLDGRKVARDGVVINGYPVPKGSMIMISLYNMHMDPNQWEDPEKFSLERWLDDDSKVAKAFFPFGDGQHRCLGEKFAVLEIKVFLILLLKNFHIGKIVKQTELVHGPTNGYKKGLWVELRKK